MLTENGWCGNETNNNQDQLWHYRTHLEMDHKAIYKKKHPHYRYTVWSFADNYEWGTYATRYGLYYVDFPDNIGDKDMYSVLSTYLNRTARTAAIWYAELATTGCFGRIQLMRNGMPTYKDEAFAMELASFTNLPTTFCIY